MLETSAKGHQEMERGIGMEVKKNLVIRLSIKIWAWIRSSGFNKHRNLNKAMKHSSKHFLEISVFESRRLKRSDY